MCPHGEHCLPDVHNLSGPVADHVHTQKLQIPGIEEKFQQTLFIPKHLAFRQLGVARKADFVGDLVLRQ